jgi:hypothetical protein
MSTGRTTAEDKARQPGEPYCSNCGYSLAGATETAVCPECGRPLVEVLTRAPRVRSGRRHYKSEATLLGLPVIHIAMGPNPETGEMRGRARGIIAIGDVAFGGVAIGGFSAGVVSFGGLSIGLFAAGGGAIGLLCATGGGAVGLGMSAGGGAVGTLAAGGGAVGYVASGGGAVGFYAQGGGAFGKHVISPSGSDPAAVAMFQETSWFFGSAGFGRPSYQPMAVCLFVVVFVGLIIAMLAILAHRLHGRRARDEAVLGGVRGPRP